MSPYRSARRKCSSVSNRPAPGCTHMTRYICKRLLLMIPTLLGAAVFVFLLMRLIPGDVCELRLAARRGPMLTKRPSRCAASRPG